MEKPPEDRGRDETDDGRPSEVPGEVRVLNDGGSGEADGIGYGAVE